MTMGTRGVQGSPPLGKVVVGIWGWGAGWAHALKGYLHLLAQSAGSSR